MTTLGLGGQMEELAQAGLFVGARERFLSVHNSQPIEDHFGPMAETLARLWGARIGVEYAESFTPIPVLGRLPSVSHL